MGFSSRVAIAGFAFAVGVAGAHAAPVLMCSAVNGNAMLVGAAAAAGGGGHSAPVGYLGIAFHDVSDGEIGPMHLKDGRGAEIIMVDHDGPAGKAGLREHDVVRSVNGIAIDGGDQLRKMLHEMQPGRTIALTVCRDGADRTITAVMSTREEVDRQVRQQRFVVPVPADEASANVAPVESPAAAPKTGFGHSFLPNHLLPLSPAYTGATVDAMGAQLADYFGVKDGKGLLVHEVETNSPAATAGLRAGDVVTRINGGRVATEKDWTRALHDSKGRAVSLTVIRDRREQTLTMIPDSKRRSSLDESTMPVMMLR